MVFIWQIASKHSLKLSVPKKDLAVKDQGLMHLVPEPKDYVSALSSEQLILLT